MHVQTLVSRSAVQGFNNGILHGFAWSNEVELHALPIDPIFERPRLGFGAIIHRDEVWALRPVQGSIKDLVADLTRHLKTGFEHRTLATPGIDDRQDQKWPSIGQDIMRKIHTLPLSRSRWRGSGASVQRDMLPPPHPLRSGMPSCR